MKSCKIAPCAPLPLATNIPAGGLESAERSEATPNENRPSGQVFGGSAPYQIDIFLKMDSGIARMISMIHRQKNGV